ncbi:MAG: isoleucine--tRNA ligase [Armatimonadota bacterium]
MDYSKTLNLPKTDFPMKANLPQREPDIQKLWDEMDLYRKSLEKDAPNGKYILHDGPPYSNGNVHVGNAMLNKLPKDFITRFRTMNGYISPYIPGWDNHGMPIENNVAAEFREKKIPVERMAIRTRCREFARHWIDTQKEQYIRLGIRGDWDRPYLTMDPPMEAAIVRVFGELAEKGFIYRGLRPILWCPTCETALADAEIEYADHTSNSIYVFFPLKDDPNGVFAEYAGNSTPGIVIWTTTPWTIPANMGVAVHPDFKYALAEFDGKLTLIASDLVEQTEGRTEQKFTILKTVNGSELEGMVFQHPVFDRDSPVLFADYVTLEEGTGVVHTAPGHGREDFDTGKKYGLDILNPVNERGLFTGDAQQFEGIHIQRGGDKAVMEALDAAGRLVSSGKITHSYPHCWRCNGPVIFRATVQWFMSLDHNGHRQKVLDEIQKVSWCPTEAINRITAMVTGAPDWCISRQRAWGVGIPVFFCTECDKEVLDRNVINAVADIVEKESADAWYSRSVEELLPSGTKCCQCGSTSFKRETDVLDVWFDSGSTCRAVLEGKSWPELSYPADLYLEGNDQHRGWFNKSLMIGVATKGSAPFREVVANGWMVDAEGHAMHKSKGNVINTQDIVKKYGADIARLTSASFNVMGDARLGDEVLQRSSDVYRRIRNTFRFLIANLVDFSPEMAPNYDDMLEIDRWILHRIQALIEHVTEAYKVYEFHRAMHVIQTFCSVDLSSLYLDILKDRLYAEATDSVERRSAQATLYHILNALVRLLAPVLAHTAEEVWQAAGLNTTDESVHLAAWPVADASLKNSELESKYSSLLDVREQVYRCIEEARQSGQIGKPVEALVSVGGGAEAEILARNQGILATFFIVSKVEVLSESGNGLTVTVMPAPGVKCERCWLIKEDIGQDPKHPDLCVRCSQVVSALDLVD